MGPIQPETSPFQTVRNWFRDKYLGMFSNRKVRVLDDPSLVPFEPLKRPDDAVPVTRRNIQLSKPQSQNLSSKQQRQENSKNHSIRKTAEVPRTAQPNQLQQQLLTECRSLSKQLGSVSGSPMHRLFEELQQKIIHSQWQDVLEMIDMELHFAGVTNLDRFLPQITRALDTASLTSPGTVEPEPAASIRKTRTDLPPKKPAANRHTAHHTPADLDTWELSLERKSLKSFQGGQVNLVIGDITEMASILGQPVEAIACPYSGTAKKGNRLYRKLAGIEPDLRKPELVNALNQYPSGKSIISGGGRLAKLGYSKLVLGLLPRPTDANPRETLVSSYEAAIQAAASQNIASIALPVFTTNMGLTPETEVAIAREAIEKHLARQAGAGNPRIYLVFPNTHNGRKQYTEHLKINNQQAAHTHSPPPTREG